MEKLEIHENRDKQIKINISKWLTGVQTNRAQWTTEEFPSTADSYEGAMMCWDLSRDRDNIVWHFWDLKFAVGYEKIWYQNLQKFKKKKKRKKKIWKDGTEPI